MKKNFTTRDIGKEDLEKIMKSAFHMSLDGIVWMKDKKNRLSALLRLSVPMLDDDEYTFKGNLLMNAEDLDRFFKQAVKERNTL